MQDEDEEALVQVSRRLSKFNTDLVAECSIPLDVDSWQRVDRSVHRTPRSPAPIHER